MSESNNEEDNFLITISDCLAVLKKGKSKLLLGTLACSFLLTLYALIKPVQYEAEATFKEKSNKGPGLSGSSIASVIMSGLSADSQSEAKTMMTSRKLLTQVIKSLGLQAALTKKTGDSPYLKNIRENLTVESAYLMNNKKHPLPDLDPILGAKNIDFSGEIPLTLSLVFETENTFRVFGEKLEPLGNGKLGTPFSTQTFSFTLSRLRGDPLNGDTYFLTLSPIAGIAKTLSANIKIEPAKEDPALLKITYQHRNRHQAPRIVNQLLFAYQDYLRTERQRISNEQISYLHMREKEMGQNLKDIIEEYANNASAEVSKVGFSDSEKAMTFLASQLQRLWERLLVIDYELKRQENLQENDKASLSDHISENTPKIILKLISEISELKQQSDAIELALRNSSARNPEQWQKTFHQQIVDLEEIRHCSEDTKILLASLETDRSPLPEVKLFDNPKYLVKTWKDMLAERDVSWKNAPLREKDSKNEERKQIRTQFIAYLTNLSHFLDMSKNTIQERLAHQQSPQFEFQGIDLATSKELYMGYNKELSGIEARILQCQFVADQLKDPEFEVSSLSTIIDDSVIIAMVNKASLSVLALQDEANHSQKEKDRLKKELDVQKRFLDLHLQQTVQLSRLSEGLLKDKIQSLQKAALELIQQQISILENQLASGIANNMSNMKQERQIIEQFQLDLREEMSKLPQKWASEKLIAQQLRINAAMVEELTKLVESKNISDNLEMVQSAPVDLAIPATHPKRPKLLLFAFLGGILGAFFTIGGLFSRLIIKGVPASKENLALTGVHVSGAIARKNPEQNLKTLRRLTAHLCSQATLPKKELRGETLAFIKGKGEDISEDLATLLSKRGDKILLLEMDLNKKHQTEPAPGLLQFLEGTIEAPTIVHSQFFDRIQAGGTCPYSNELLGSEKFLNLLDQLKSRYDWIIGITDAAPDSAETENLFHFFDHALIGISSETLQELHHVIRLTLSLPPERKISFIKT